MFQAHPRVSVLILAASLSISAIAASALAQNGLPYTIEAPPGSRYFGSRVVSGGDANHDGFDDIFVVDDGTEANGELFGRWYMYSGIDGTMLWSGVGSDPITIDRYQFFAAAFLGDLDGDQCDDVILGRPGLMEGRGGVDVLSGRTGEVIYSYRGAAPDDWMGICVTGLDDANGDHTADFAFVDRYTLAGRVSVRSGIDGTEIRGVDIEWPRRVRNAGDVDGDLVPDLVIGAPQSGFLRLVSGADGHTFWDMTQPDPHDRTFGYELAAGTDVTGDHVPDILASSNIDNFRLALVYVLSGATGEIVTTLQPSAHNYVNAFGTGLAFADLNADGSPDAIVGSISHFLAFDPVSGAELNARPIRQVRTTLTGTEMAIGNTNGDAFPDIITGHLAQYPGGGSVVVESGGSLLLGISDTVTSNHIARGQRTALFVHGAPPNHIIHLLGSPVGHDCTFVQQLGICIDLDPRIYYLGQGTPSTDGLAYIEFFVRYHAPLGPVWVQALEIDDHSRGPITSNVLPMVIVE